MTHDPLTHDRLHEPLHDSASGFSEEAGFRPDVPRQRRGDVIGAFTDAVRNNPMSAALIGLGALWLFAGGNNTSLLGGHGRRSLLRSVAHGAGSVAHGTGDAIHGATSAVSRAGGTVASGVSSTVGGMTESVSHAAHRVTDYVGGKLQGVDAQSEYHDTTFGDEDFAYRSQSNAGRMSSLSEMRHSMQDLFERHPVALGVAGLALGAGVAASIPLTGTERDTLGRAGEAMKSRLAEAKEQAMDMAGAAMDEVKQGLGGGNTGSPV